DEYLRQHRRANAARCYQNLAYVLTEMGRWTEAERVLDVADQLNRTLRGPRQASYFEYSKGSLALYRGNIEEATRHVDAAIELAKQANDAFVLMGHQFLRGLIEVESGQFDNAARIARETLVTARERESPASIVDCLYLLGVSARGAGRTAQALKYLEEGRRVAVAKHQPVMLFRTQLVLAEALATQGQHERADRLLAESRAIQERSESVLWKGLLALSEGRVLETQGDPERAAQVLTLAYETFAQLGAERYRAEVLLSQATTHLSRGSQQAARAALRHARELLRTLGLPAPPSPFPDDETDPGDSLHTVRRILETASLVSRDITSLQSVDEVLERILQVAITYLGTERGVVALANPETGELEVKFARNIDRESIADTLEISQSTMLNVSREGEMIHTGDALNDPQLSLRESIRKGRIRSLITLPIRWGAETLGAIYMDHRTLTDLFGREERLFLRFIADMAAIGIRNARQFEIREEAVRNLRGELEEDELLFPNTVVGKDSRMRELLRRGLRALRSGRVVLLTGPSGAGKDHLARVLHDAMAMKGEFVDCPLPTLPAELIGPELFGIAPKTATQVFGRTGLAEAAQGGTLFLNEIADLPLALQPMLLHFVDRREFRRTGSTATHRLDGLIICATNADLEKKVKDGTFRADLFYRLADEVLEIPPLRERPEDIPHLADLFFREFERKTGRPRCHLSTLALDRLMRCAWEGNVRELKACLSRAVDAADGGMIQVQHLESPSLKALSEDSAGGRGGMLEEIDLIEVRKIEEAMGRAGGIITRAAKLLDLSETSLRRRIAKHHLKHLVTRPKKRKGDT
ncbi:MAG: sigma 54-interacting transcriptional regulator, partial [Gemmatimonadetes bacterium]|nr:sigma 54-interacting transcriptional regulator [Gemmatimonadota bacterium]